MPLHSKRITDTIARALPAPPAGYAIHWCPGTPGFGVRVTSAGARAWIAERRVDGKTVRRTLGKAAGAAAISADAARRLQLDVSSELQQGKDRLQERRQRAATEKQESITLEAALKEYVAKKRRGKDGLALKERTREDYLAMVQRGGTAKSGRPTLNGSLYELALRPITRITGADMRSLYGALQTARGERQAVYAMQVLRAVLNWHGVTVPDNPLGKTVAGRDRIVLPQPKGNPRPIPPEHLGAWWNAAREVNSVSADQLRFQLLTGCRPGEAAGLLVGDVDFLGGRAVLRDTKNRSEHVVLLSRQALELAKRRGAGKKAEPLFGVADPGKTLAAINQAAGVSAITPHKLRHTFASIAAQLVPAFTLRRMLNHAAGDDVAAAHYVGVGEAQLRAGWQALADFIEAEAAQRE